LTVTLRFSKMGWGRLIPALKDLMPRSPASRQARSTSVDVTIPDKPFFRINEVSELTRTKAHVLRYWETEFPSLKPDKSHAGRRIYSREDLEMILKIKRLLYEEGFTIAGARKQLSSETGSEPGGPSETAHHERPHSSSTLDGQHLRAIKRELQGILTILSSKC
jgi:DNA-binding transcriptional MerR regulator